jgi:pyruvate-formate lyase
MGHAVQSRHAAPLADHGIALADARNYAPIGCIELTVPGKANPHAVSGWINAAKCLELALFDGVDPRTGQQIGPQTGSLADHKAYDDLWSAYERQLEHFTRAMVYHCNRGELAQRERGPLPCWWVTPSGSTCCHPIFRNWSSPGPSIGGKGGLRTS